MEPTAQMKGRQAESYVDFFFKDEVRSEWSQYFDIQAVAGETVSLAPLKVEPCKSLVDVFTALEANLGSMNSPGNGFGTLLELQDSNQDCKRLPYPTIPPPLASGPVWKDPTLETDFLQGDEDEATTIPPITWKKLGYRGRTIIIKELAGQWGSFDIACEEIGLGETWLDDWLIRYKAEREDRREWQANLNSWIEQGVGVPEDYDGPGPCHVLITQSTIYKVRRCLEFLGLVALADRVEAWNGRVVVWPPKIVLDPEDPNELEEYEVLYHQEDEDEEGEDESSHLDSSNDDDEDKDDDHHDGNAHHDDPRNERYDDEDGGLVVVGSEPESSEQEDPPKLHGEYHDVSSDTDSGPREDEPGPDKYHHISSDADGGLRKDATSPNEADGKDDSDYNGDDEDSDEDDDPRPYKRRRTVKHQVKVVGLSLGPRPRQTSALSRPYHAPAKRLALVAQRSVPVGSNALAPLASRPSATKMPQRPATSRPAEAPPKRGNSVRRRLPPVPLAPAGIPRAKPRPAGEPKPHWHCGPQDRDFPDTVFDNTKPVLVQHQSRHYFARMPRLNDCPARYVYLARELKDAREELHGYRVVTGGNPLAGTLPSSRPGGESSKIST